MANKIIDGIEPMNEPEFNWYTELNKAIKVVPSKEKVSYLIDMACAWETGAGWKLCKSIQKDNLGRPIDNELLEYGLWFSKSIIWRKWVDAKIALNLIEERTAELLNEQRNG